MIIPGQRRKQLAFLVLHSKHVYCTKIWHVNWVFMCTQVKSVSSMTSACTAYYNNSQSHDKWHEISFPDWSDSTDNGYNINTWITVFVPLS